MKRKPASNKALERRKDMAFHCPNCLHEKADTEEGDVSFFAHLGLFLMTKGTWWGGRVCEACAKQVTMVGWTVFLFVAFGFGLAYFKS